MAEMIKGFPEKVGTETPPRAAGEMPSALQESPSGEATGQKVVKDVQRVATQMGGQAFVPLVDKARGELERFSRFLGDADAEEVVRGTERFARREPLLFLGGAFALGILGARFLKSSARSQPEGPPSRGRS